MWHKNPDLTGNLLNIIYDVENKRKRSAKLFPFRIEVSILPIEKEEKS